jgi:acetyl esterase/lipase
MRPEDYPAQEPFTEIGGRYHARVTELGAGIEGVEIRHGADAYQSVAIYPAAAPRGDVLCLIHGGGWTNGYKEWMAFMAPALTARGITVATLGYRLAPQHVWPAGFEDVADGVAAVWRSVASHGGDPARIFLGGHSAGGHLASLLALRRDWQGPRGLPDTVVRGALPISGTYLFGPESGLSMRPRFLGDPSLANEAPASPMAHVAAGAPPFFVSWGEKDFPHLAAQARRFADALAAAGVRVDTMQMPGADHLGASYASGEAGGDWVRAADAFMTDR